MHFELVLGDLNTFIVHAVTKPGICRTYEVCQKGNVRRSLIRKRTPGYSWDYTDRRVGHGTWDNRLFPGNCASFLGSYPTFSCFYEAGEASAPHSLQPNRRKSQAGKMKDRCSLSIVYSHRSFDNYLDMADNIFARKIVAFIRSRK